MVSILCLILLCRYSGKRKDCISMRNCFSFSIACLISKIVVRCLTRARPKLWATLTRTICRSNRYLSMGVFCIWCCGDMACCARLCCYCFFCSDALLEVILIYISIIYYFFNYFILASNVILLIILTNFYFLFLDFNLFNNSSSQQQRKLLINESIAKLSPANNLFFLFSNL